MTTHHSTDPPSPTAWSGPRSCRRGSSRRANATATRPTWRWPPRAPRRRSPPPSASAERSGPCGEHDGRVTTVDELECPFDIVTPYKDGLDVRRRPEWKTVAVLPRPVTKPPKKERR